MRPIRSLVPVLSALFTGALLTTLVQDAMSSVVPERDGRRAAAALAAYRIVPDPAVPGSFRTRNPAQGLEATFRPEGIEVVAGGRARDAFRMKLLGHGRGGSLEPAPRPRLAAAKNRIEYRREGIVEWWVNDPRGIEHGFDVGERPEGEGPLVVELGASGDLLPRPSAGRRGVTLEGGEAHLGYAELHAFDATGAALGSRMEILGADEGSRIRLVVDDHGAAYPVTIDPILKRETRLVSPAASAEDGFGVTVAISADTAIVGQDTMNSFTDPGAAYVFERDAGGPGSWDHVATLTASDAHALDNFGEAVGISGDFAIVGSSENDGVGANSGAAYVFERDSGGADNWGEVVKLLASDEAGGDGFGEAVAIDGDTALVTAPGNDDDGSGSGAAYVFERDEGGPGNWGEVVKLTASDADQDDGPGSAVAISGDIAVLGVRRHESGAVYVFERDLGGPDNWGERVKLVPSDSGVLPIFGRAVALDGDTLLVGAGGLTNDTTGAVYVFERDAGGPDNWGEVAKLTSPLEEQDDNFGNSVGISGDLAVIGAEFDDERSDAAGAAYVLERDLGGPDNWGQLRKITGSDLGDHLSTFGHAAAISGETAVVGAQGFQEESGVAYVYDESTLCEDGPASCVALQKGTFLVQENSPGKEKLKAKLQSGPTLNQLGDPLTKGGTQYTLCIYDDANDLAGELNVTRAAGECAGRPCWKPTSTGFSYADKNASADGAKRLTLKGGSNPKLQVQAANKATKDQISLPTGIAAALAGSTSATVQLHGHDLAQCFEVTYDDVSTNAGNVFKAKR